MVVICNFGRRVHTATVQTGELARLDQIEIDYNTIMNAQQLATQPINGDSQISARVMKLTVVVSKVRVLMLFNCSTPVINHHFCFIYVKAHLMHKYGNKKNNTGPYT